MALEELHLPKFEITKFNGEKAETPALETLRELIGARERVATDGWNRRGLIWLYRDSGAVFRLDQTSLALVEFDLDSRHDTLQPSFEFASFGERYELALSLHVSYLQHFLAALKENPGGWFNASSGSNRISDRSQLRLESNLDREIGVTHLTVRKEPVLARSA